ncbi:uncharacterized protein LOC122007412 [Zingiber officinale]|uniref:uncharacterized protein LOC122007412 n=1 Tax=Zingiber officinale TaxID=94328 RepID=UPI001C4AC7C1|nr:uncharacterized protein LOC122007412 [Zingiber officinale]
MCWPLCRPASGLVAVVPVASGLLAAVSAAVPNVTMPDAAMPDTAVPNASPSCVGCRQQLADGYIIMAEQQTVALRGYKVIRVVRNTFVPDGHRVASYIASKFKKQKRYTWEDGQEEQFKATWNSYCAKLYRDLMYYIKKKGTRPAYVSEMTWSAWTTTWAAERWQENAEKARSNRNTEPGGPSTGIARHTSGSKSIVEHAMDLEHDLAWQPTCMEVFLKTHKKKDGSFIDSRSRALHEQMTERVAQASQPPSEGEE